MDQRQIRYFTAVFEEGSISAASRRLFVAQPSVSNAIAQLEDEVGTQLFLRHRHGVTPTHEAKAFYSRAVKIMGELKTLATMFSDPGEPAELSLGIMPAINVGQIATFLKLLIQRIDHLSLRLVTMEEASDARIVSDHALRKGDRFVPLWNEKYVLAVPTTHALAVKMKVTFADLNGVRLIERCHCEHHDKVSSALAQHKIIPDIVARAQNEEWALALVGAGLGVALVPEGSIRSTQDIVIRPMTGLSMVRRVGIAYDPKATPSSALRATIALCRNGSRNQPG